MSSLSRLLSRFSCCCVLLSVLVGPLAHAQEKWRDLPPEERRQLRQQMREQWQERQERGQEREYRREIDAPPTRRWHDVPQEERRQMRQQMREEIGEHRATGFPEHDRPPPPGSGRSGWRHER